ncbi:hypothetical protein ACJ73_10080, partial [Blastomyces percursus]
FHIQQLLASVPSASVRLFSNRTSATGYILTILSSVLIQAISYFLPVYFQAVKGTTILRSGVYVLPFTDLCCRVWRAPQQIRRIPTPPRRWLLPLGILVSAFSPSLISTLPFLPRSFSN